MLIRCWPLLGFVLSCSSPAAPPDGPRLSVLFIGNSLTAANDLPRMVAALADSAGLPPLYYRTVLENNTSLEDHWRTGEAQRRIAGTAWDFVVMQQGSSALASSRELLLDYTRRFAEVIRAHGARPALFTVWPNWSRKQDFPGVLESYRLAAQAVDGLLIPAGDVWQETLVTGHVLPLYQDDLHPTALGSYAAALMMVQRLYGRDPAGLPARFACGSTIISIDTAAARVLQLAVRAVHQRTGQQ